MSGMTSIERDMAAALKEIITLSQRGVSRELAAVRRRAAEALEDAQSSLEDRNA